MFGTLGLRTRLILVTLGALVCPHPVSFREGGYLPVAVVLTIIPGEFWNGMLMFALLFGVYFLVLLAVSLALFRPKRSMGRAASTDQPST